MRVSCYICYALLLVVGVGFPAFAEAGPREVSVVLRPGYSHKKAVTLFKRNLRLQGWRVTARQKARWRIRLCSTRSLSTQVCVKHGSKWRLFRGPKRKISPSTRARLLLLYFNMMQMQPARTKQSSGVGCGCGAKRPSAPVKRRSRRRKRSKRITRSAPIIRTQRVAAKHNHGTPGAHDKTPKTPKASAPKAALPLAIPPKPLKKRKAPPTRRVALAIKDDDDEDTFGEMANIRGISAPKRSSKEWSWWLAVAVSGDVYWSGSSDIRPGSTLHLRTGWGRFGIHTSLKLHAFFLQAGRSILLVRPSLALEWTFWPKGKIGRSTFSFGLHAGLTTEHNVDEEATGAYTHNMQVGPKLGGQIHWQFAEGWSLFWRSSFAVAFAPGDATKSPLYQWQNDLGIQFRVQL